MGASSKRRGGMGAPAAAIPHQAGPAPAINLLIGPAEPNAREPAAALPKKRSAAERPRAEAGLAKGSKATGQAGREANVDADPGLLCAGPPLRR